jgi:hypothetical protein
MDLSNMDLEFESEDDLPEDEFTRKRIPENTECTVVVRAEKDKALGEFRSGESQYGPWMIIPFEVTEGEYKGEWLSQMVNIKTSDRRFRKLFQTVTGVDISAGGKVSFDQFKTDLLGGVFVAMCGPEVRKIDGEKKETGYNKVFYLKEKVGERDVSAVAGGSDAEAPGQEDGVGDEDIPF